jgi:hypothetical protein
MRLSSIQLFHLLFNTRRAGRYMRIGGNKLTAESLSFIVATPPRTHRHRAQRAPQVFLAIQAPQRSQSRQPAFSETLNSHHPRGQACLVVSSSRVEQPQPQACSGANNSRLGQPLPQPQACSVASSSRPRQPQPRTYSEAQRPQRPHNLRRHRVSSETRRPRLRQSLHSIWVAQLRGEAFCK